MKIIALDQSLTETGVAIWVNGELTLEIIAPKTKGVQRLLDIRQTISQYIIRYAPQLMIIEDYAFGATGHAFSLGELGGMLKVFCEDNKVPLLPIPIAIHKIYTTGKGNSKKELLIKEVFKKYQIDTDNNNLADAVSILQTVLGYLQHKKETEKPLIERHTKAITKLEKLLNNYPRVRDILSAEAYGTNSTHANKER